MPKVRLTKKDLPVLIENIEKNDGDASALRAILEEPGKPSDEKLSDEDFIAAKLEEATVVEGESICPLCERPVDKLYCGVCGSCFGDWALAAKKE